jgi:hypothetical protein
LKTSRREVVLEVEDVPEGSCGSIAGYAEIFQMAQLCF